MLVNKCVLESFQPFLNMGAKTLHRIVVTIFGALVTTLLVADCSANSDDTLLIPPRLVQNYTFGERDNSDYPFYAYSECRNYSNRAAAFIKCTRFTDPKNVTYAYFVTNKTAEIEHVHVYISKGGIGQEMVEFCISVENVHSYCFHMQVFGFENTSGFA